MNSKMLSSGVAMDMVNACLEVAAVTFNMTIDMNLNVGNVGLKQTVEQSILLSVC